MKAALSFSQTAIEPLPGQQSSMLRIFTCGSVDDGKSTLLGRLLFDSNAVPDDQLAALDRDSRRFGTDNQARDFALLVDGLTAEREQGITIDVAYRYFSTPSRSFIVADTPGHEQYTRNMATGASCADLAIILVDARKGILPQTRRHSFIASMVGVRHVVLAVNKLDLVGFDKSIYEGIVTAYGDAVASLDFVSVIPIPLCARDGDNITTRSARTPWYSGPVLLSYLETVTVGVPPQQPGRFHFPVQWVNRPNLDFRGYAGTISAGTVRVDDDVTILPGGQRSRINRIVTADGDLESASAGQAVTLTLDDEIGIARGDIIIHGSATLQARPRQTARLLWMAEQPLHPGQDFIVKLATIEANVTIRTLRHAIDIHSFRHHPAEALPMNAIGIVDLLFDRPIAALPYSQDRDLGSFILIDRMTNRTVALGTIEANPPDQANDNHRLRSAIHFINPMDSPRRWAFWQRVERTVIEALALFLVVFVLARNPWLAVAVTAADLLLRPIAGRLATWGWNRLFASHSPQDNRPDYCSDSTQPAFGRPILP
jgi:bifunctional enzyme CysN/CysC